MDRAELLYNRRFLRNALLEAILKLMELAFLLVQVFDQSAASLLHLIQSSLQSDPEGSHVLLPLPDLVIRVLRVPHIVGDELL